MWKIIVRAGILLLALTLLTGVIYPLAVTGMAWLFFPDQANGSLIRFHDKVVGSALIGQDFKSPQYFHGRPSVAGYDGMASGGSNMGPTNRQLIETIRERAAKIRNENQVPATRQIPSDLVTASGSGLDPHISVAGALLQVPRVAKARHLNQALVRELVNKNTELPFLGVLGARRVHVLKLNLALESLRKR